jgi:hypothetical protein
MKAVRVIGLLRADRSPAGAVGSIQERGESVSLGPAAEHAQSAGHRHAGAVPPRQNGRKSAQGRGRRSQWWLRRMREGRRSCSPAADSPRRADKPLRARPGHPPANSRRTACSRRSRRRRLGRSRRPERRPQATAGAERARAHRRRRARPTCDRSGDTWRQCRVGALRRPPPRRRRGCAVRPRPDIAG